jgi:translation elongation factor EF-G
MMAEARFDSVGIIYNALNKHHASAIGEEYTVDGRLLLRFQVPVNAVTALQCSISDATSGAVVPRLVTYDP